MSWDIRVNSAYALQKPSWETRWWAQLVYSEIFFFFSAVWIVHGVWHKCVGVRSRKIVLTQKVGTCLLAMDIAHFRWYIYIILYYIIICLHNNLKSSIESIGLLDAIKLFCEAHLFYSFIFPLFWINNGFLSERSLLILEPASFIKLNNGINPRTEATGVSWGDVIMNRPGGISSYPIFNFKHKFKKKKKKSMTIVM